MPESTAVPPQPGRSRAVPPPDLRDTITAEAFRVAPELLGAPLARPWRRGVAMALDGLLIVLLSSASGVLFGLAAALVLFRISGRPAPGGYIRRSIRLVLRFWAAVIMFVVVLSLIDEVDDRIDARRDRSEATPAAAAEDDGQSIVNVGGRVGMDMGLLAMATSEAQAREVTGRLVPALRGAGMSDEEILDMLEGFAEMPGKPWMAAVADSVARQMNLPAAQRDSPEDSVNAEESASPEDAVVAYAEALESGDTALVRELRPTAAGVIAGDSLAALHAEIRERERRRAALAQRVDQLEDRLEQGPGIMGRLRALADDLGLGLGWAGLYFTTFVTLWKGRTPGKRIMRIRVIRLDGEQIGWWAAFERFGGYAAGVATGLLGFAQIYWDRNRQAVQDKLSETVVVQDGARAE